MHPKTMRYPHIQTRPQHLPKGSDEWGTSGEQIVLSANYETVNLL